MTFKGGVAGLVLALAMAAAPALANPAKVAIQVDQNDAAVMNLALNNAANIAGYYAAKGEEVEIAVVAYGPGLHMLRDDTSPVKDRIVQMSMEGLPITFDACANTLKGMAKAEGAEPKLIDEATVVPSGAVKLMELQGEGYAYLRP